MRRVFQVAVVVMAVTVSQSVAPGARGHAAVIVNSLLVRVYDSTGGVSADRARALTRAREILQRVDIDTAWLDCPPHGLGRWRSECHAPPAPGEFVVRLVRASAQANRAHPRALGYSLIDTQTRRGTLATIFTDRIDLLLAQRTHFDRASVLGRAIAHELGHLILGTNAHGMTGLMREIWTVDELRRDRPEDWEFTPAEREDLQAARQAGAPLAAKGRPGGAGTGGQNPRNLLDKTP